MRWVPSAISLGQSRDRFAELGFSRMSGTLGETSPRYASKSALSCCWLARAFRSRKANFDVLRKRMGSLAQRPVLVRDLRLVEPRLHAGDGLLGRLEDCVQSGRTIGRVTSRYWPRTWRSRRTSAMPQMKLAIQLIEWSPCGCLSKLRFSRLLRYQSETGDGTCHHRNRSLCRQRSGPCRRMLTSP